MSKTQILACGSCQTPLGVVVRAIITEPSDERWPRNTHQYVFWCPTCKSVPDARHVHIANRPTPAATGEPG